MEEEKERDMRCHQLEVKERLRSFNVNDMIVHNQLEDKNIICIRLEVDALYSWGTPMGVGLPFLLTDVQHWLIYQTHRRSDWFWW